MKNLLKVLCIILFAVSCSSDETHDNANISFFPIAGNINAELKELDTLPVGINKYTTSGNVTDTGVASKEELKQAADALIKPDISDPAIKKYYTETVFYDKSSDFLTMSYATTSDKPEVRKIEVLIKQETDKLRSIYVEKVQKKNDSVINNRMVWTPGKSLQVITITSLDGKENVKTVKYAWGVE